MSGPPLKIGARQIIKHQPNPLGKCLPIKCSLQGNPPSVEQIQRLVKLVLVKRLGGGQAAGPRQGRALGLLAQRQFGRRKQNPPQDHRLEQPLLPGSSQAGQATIQTVAPPGVVEHGQATVVLRGGEFKVAHGNQRLAPEAGGDELAHFLGQATEIADGAGAGTFGGAEGLAHQVGDVGLAVAGRFSGLHEHGLHHIATKSTKALYCYLLTYYWLHKCAFIGFL